MALYSYSGPVLEFDRIICNNWSGQTYASTEARARSNLAYQFKKETGRVARTKITLPGKITSEEMSKHERTCIHSEFAQV